MDREVQFLLYYMPEDSGKVQAVIKDEAIRWTKKLWHSHLGRLTCNRQTSEEHI